MFILKKHSLTTRAYHQFLNLSCCFFSTTGCFCENDLLYCVDYRESILFIMIMMVGLVGWYKKRRFELVYIVNKIIYITNQRW